MSPERTCFPVDDPKMSVPASPVAGTPICEAQSPISLLLAVAQAQSGNSKNPDDDLTSLSWLHEKDILKGMNINPSPSSSTTSTPNRYFALSNILPDHSPNSDCAEDSPGDSSNGSLSTGQVVPRNKHLHNVPYDPMVHTLDKPPYSFSCLIFMAIEESPQKALPVRDIYWWILNHFPYFQSAPIGWKNSVRHNLSLNKCFQKVEKAPNLGKGSLWTVDPQYRPNLVQALFRSPFHPCSTLELSSQSKVEKQPRQPVAFTPRLPDPNLFPYLAHTLAAAEAAKTSDESLDAVDAAAVMLSLKNGPRIRQKTKKGSQIITTSPSQDHTYTATLKDNDDDCDEEDEQKFTKSPICRKIDFDDDEEQRKINGAEMLLHLAGVPRTRYQSSCETAPPSKRLKSDSEDKEESKTFKPRLLRTKKREIKKRLTNNNNNEWLVHRKAVETSLTGR